MDAAIMKKPNIHGMQIMRLRRLVDTEYKPSEIAEIMGVTTETVYRSYLEAGCPCYRDAEKNVWIRGYAFKAWAEALYKGAWKKPKAPMSDTQAFCFSCNQVIEIERPAIRKENTRRKNLYGKCPLCGGKVNRFISVKKEL